MHDLRKQAILESGKTTSRKKQRNIQSGATTPNISRVASAVASRDVSDDESDFGTGSVQSLDRLVASLPVELWTADLNERIESICDRKRSSTGGREGTINAFNNLLTYHFAQDELKPRETELLGSLIKSVKSDESSREVEVALRAIALIMITNPSDETFTLVHDVVKTAAEESAYIDAKVIAIRTLAIVMYYSDSPLDESDEMMEWLSEIVSSDGMTVGEEDSSDIVVATLEAWGLLATQFDELPPSAESAIDAFIDQLESTSTEVVCAAAQVLALLIEISYADVGEEDDDEDEEPEEVWKPKKYALSHQAHRIANLLEQRSKLSTKSISKRDRQSFQSCIRDVLLTIEDPRRGPGYSTALDRDGYVLGSRMKVTIDNVGNKITIDKWWMLLRLNPLKKLLRAGFVSHYKSNPAVMDALPAATLEDDRTDSDRPQYATKHMRNVADFLDAPDD